MWSVVDFGKAEVYKKRSGAQDKGCVKKSPPQEKSVLNYEKRCYLTNFLLGSQWLHIILDSK